MVRFYVDLSCRERRGRARIALLRKTPSCVACSWTASSTAGQSRPCTRASCASTTATSREWRFSRGLLDAHHSSVARCLDSRAARRPTQAKSPNAGTRGTWRVVGCGPRQDARLSRGLGTAAATVTTGTGCSLRPQGAWSGGGRRTEEGCALLGFAKDPVTCRRSPSSSSVPGQSTWCRWSSSTTPGSTHRSSS